MTTLTALSLDKLLDRRAALLVELESASPVNRYNLELDLWKVDKELSRRERLGKDLKPSKPDDGQLKLF